MSCWFQGIIRYWASDLHRTVVLQPASRSFVFSVLLRLSFGMEHTTYDMYELLISITTKSGEMWGYSWAIKIVTRPMLLFIYRRVDLSLLLLFCYSARIICVIDELLIPINLQRSGEIWGNKLAAKIIEPATYCSVILQAVLRSFLVNVLFSLSIEMKQPNPEINEMLFSGSRRGDMWE